MENVIDAREAMASITLSVKVERVTEAKARLHIGARLIRMAASIMGVNVEISALDTHEKLARRNRARDAAVAVLERHGYHIPGVADLCAGAALRAAGFDE